MNTYFYIPLFIFLFNSLGALGMDPPEPSREDNLEENLLNNFYCEKSPNKLSDEEKFLRLIAKKLHDTRENDPDIEFDSFIEAFLKSFDDPNMSKDTEEIFTYLFRLGKSNKSANSIYNKLGKRDQKEEVYFQFIKLVIDITTEKIQPPVLHSNRTNRFCLIQ